MSKSPASTVAAALSFILTFGPGLYLAAASEGDKKRVYYTPGAKSAPNSSRAAKVRKPNFAARVQASSLLPGQTATLLPDGRTLLVGGEGQQGPLTTVLVSDARTGAPVPLASQLRHARAHHTATLLPDGRVLLIGGVGLDGRAVGRAEVFDFAAQASELLPAAGLAARSHHTATLLTDGRVLVVGGASDDRRASAGAELWDFRTRRATTQQAGLSVARRGHKATLLTDGNVLVEGGVDAEGNQVAGSELYSPEARAFNFTNLSSGQADAGAPFLAGSLPADGATGVPADTLIALRFSLRLRVESLNSDTVTLTGPEGVVKAGVIPAEGGRLAFVTPKQALLEGATYTAALSGAVDESAQQIAPASFSFTTADGGGEDDQPSDAEDWVPDASNLHGNWRSKRGDSPWRRLPLLGAEAGVTALAGQVLALDGRPLEGVTLRVGDASCLTDKTGRFLLASIGAGHQVMVIDGRTASRPNKMYGIFRVGVNILAGKTNPLGYTVWMPKLDTKNAVTVASPTTAATTVVNPRIPGLELRLPAGTVIRGMDGQAVTRVSITPIPTDRTPFPLPPNVDVPIYFTIQPGGSQVIPPRAQLVYPNFLGSQPGARIDFYNYDATGRGWYVYGQGTVTRDGRQIVPDAGVALYEFSGAMVASPSFAPSTFVSCGRGNSGGLSMDLGTGLFVLSGSDLGLPGLGALSLGRTYRPNDTRSRAFGVGSSHTYDTYLVGDTFPYTFMDLVGPDGSRVHYNRVSAGTSWADAVYEAESCGTSSCAAKSVIRWNGGGWIVIYEDGTKLLFPDAFEATSPRRSALIGYEDRYGNALSFVRDGAANLTRVTAASGRWMGFTYDAANRITQARDNIGRAVSYAYDAAGRLASVTDQMNGVQAFTYDSSHRMTEVMDERGITVLKNEYDAAGRVIKQTLADDTPATTDNPVYQFAYTVDSGGRVTQTDVTDPRGVVRRVTFDAGGFTTGETYALGMPEEQAVTFERQEGTNRPLSVTDNVGRKTAYTYDAVGRMTEVTYLAETAEAVTTQYGYSQTCECDDVLSMTDALNRTTNFEYDDKKNLIGVTDPLNHKTTYTYNAAGQALSVKDALNNTAQFAYEGGDLASVTNPQGRTASRFVDGAGRTVSLRTPLGQPSRIEYDALSRPLKVRDALGGVTEFSYDAAGNVLSVKDARSNVTSYVYNSIGQVTSRTDPLGRVESYLYDEAGVLKKYTDRRGKVTTYSYDGLSRLTFLGFGTVGEGVNATYESTINYTYDAAGRLEQVLDSVSGMITYAYDNFSRVTSKTTPQGTISYTYDAVGRRTGMTVAGQAAVTYTYDDADRLTQITQGAAGVAFDYDSTDRLTSTSWSNGITVEYVYDESSSLTGITYRKGSVVLGDLTYQYDDAGRRVSAGGSFARTGMPQPLTSPAYDEANRLTQRAGANLTYDNNGNLTSDGTNTYTWDARNQLASIAGPGLTASFQYDASGRRINKTVNGVSTSYLYDGANAVQELSGTTPMANVLMGGVDNVFTRTDAAGARTPLTDGQGSTLALADDSGGLQTQYTYDPFGSTASAGSASGNSSQYTGRENDETGLYYYRARYYSPSLQRFISEDPAGFGGGDVNLYAYVGNDPVNFVDPSGQCGTFSLANTSGQRLSPCVKKIFEQVFTNGSLDLSKIRLHTGIPWYIEELATITPGAVTTGRDIYFRDGWQALYDADHLGALTTMAEELWHSLQAKLVAGWIRPLWADAYLTASAKARLRGGDPYNDNAFEVEAKNVAGLIREWMERTYGQDPCATLGLSPY